MLHIRPRALWSIGTGILAMALYCNWAQGRAVSADTARHARGARALRSAAENAADSAALADGVASALLPARALEVDADPTECERTDGTRQKVTEFSYRDAYGHAARHVSLVVDSSRSEVLYVHVTPSRDPARACIGRDAAIQSAENWMRETRVAEQSPWWSLACSPEHMGGEWLVTWRGADRAALVALRDTDGYLDRAITSRMPPFGPAWFPPRALAALGRQGLLAAARPVAYQPIP